MLNPLSHAAPGASAHPGRPSRPRPIGAFRVVAGAGACALALATTACGSQITTTTHTHQVVPTTVSTTPLPTEPVFKGTPAGAAADVTVKECGLDAGKQTASGTVTNSTKKPRDYAIMIIWLRNNDGKPYGSAITTVKAAQPGKATAWSVSTNVSTKVDMCAKNVRAGALGK